MFETKLKENTMLNDNKSSITDEAIDDENAMSSQGGRPKTRSLNSVVAMLTAGRKDGGSSGRSASPSHQLLDQYKHTKKNNNKKNNKADIIDLVDDDHYNRNRGATVNSMVPAKKRTTATTINTNIVNSDGADKSIDIPGKGQYRIMEQIVTKQGERNKIILKLGKPSNNNNNNSNSNPTNNRKQNSVAGNDRNNSQAIQQQQQRNTTHPTHAVRHNNNNIAATTDVNDMYTLENMVRSHNGLDEMLRNRFDNIFVGFVFSCF